MIHSGGTVSAVISTGSKRVFNCRIVLFLDPSRLSTSGLPASACIAVAARLKTPAHRSTDGFVGGTVVAEIDVYKEWLGIPEGDRPPDHYTLLRLVMFEDDVEKVRSNYRKLNGHVRTYASGQYLKASQDLLNELAKAMLCLTDRESRREYDISLGREPKQAEIQEARTTLEYLLIRGVIKRGQIGEIEHFADARGLSHRDAVVQMNLADPAAATRGMAAELHMPFVDLQDTLPEDDVLDGLPRNLVKRHTCLPLFEDGGRLLVACADEPSPELEDEVRMRFGIPMRGVLAVPRQINQAIAKHYAPGTRTEAVAEGSDVANSEVRSGDSKSSGTNRKTAAKNPGTPLTDDEKANRRNISLIAICWAVIIPMVGMSTLTELSGLTQFGITAFITAVAAGGLRLTWWK